MRCCFQTFKDLCGFYRILSFERDAKVGAFIKSPKTFCHFSPWSYSQKGIRYFEELSNFLERTAKIRRVSLSTNFFSHFFPISIPTFLLLIDCRLCKELYRYWINFYGHSTLPHSSFLLFSSLRRLLFFNSGCKDRQLYLVAKYFLILFSFHWLKCPSDKGFGTIKNMQPSWGDWQSI